jgi:hypothetical protein
LKFVTAELISFSVFIANLIGKNTCNVKHQIELLFFFTPSLFMFCPSPS